MTYDIVCGKNPDVVLVGLVSCDVTRHLGPARYLTRQQTRQKAEQDEFPLRLIRGRAHTGRSAHTHCPTHTSGCARGVTTRTYAAARLPARARAHRQPEWHRAARPRSNSKSERCLRTAAHPRLFIPRPAPGPLPCSSSLIPAGKFKLRARAHGCPRGPRPRAAFLRTAGVRHSTESRALQASGG